MSVEKTASAQLNLNSVPVLSIARNAKLYFGTIRFGHGLNLLISFISRCENGTLQHIRSNQYINRICIQSLIADMHWLVKFPGTLAVI
jgi:hypothetical protein